MSTFLRLIFLLDTLTLIEPKVFNILVYRVSK